MAPGSASEAEAQAADEQAERELGTVVKPLYRRGQHKAVSTLLAAQNVHVKHDHSDWGIGHFDVRLEVDVDSFDEHDDREVLDQIRAAYDEVWQVSQREVESVSLHPALVPPTWRRDVEGFLRPPVSNQAAIAPLPERAPHIDGLKFRDNGEVVMYQALKAKQQSFPHSETLTIAPNPGVRLPGRTIEPDFLVVYQGRTGVIEVDGTSHRKKWASDKSRDTLLEDSGITYVGRIDVADAEKPAEVEQFIERFLARLMR